MNLSYLGLVLRQERVQSPDEVERGRNVAVHERDVLHVLLLREGLGTGAAPEAAQHEPSVIQYAELVVPPRRRGVVRLAQGREVRVEERVLGRFQVRGYQRVRQVHRDVSHREADARRREIDEQRAVVRVDGQEGIHRLQIAVHQARAGVRGRRREPRGDPGRRFLHALAERRERIEEPLRSRRSKGGHEARPVAGDRVDLLRVADGQREGAADRLERRGRARQHGRVLPGGRVEPRRRLQHEQRLRRRQR
mmetsp:Transcript_18504/g.55020  ORF Transcript_18504/g.55020 Transcript_18504/m.55020 type:complete len:251 (-) Transcript_18504:490-1242(-)